MVEEYNGKTSIRSLKDDEEKNPKMGIIRGEFEHVNELELEILQMVHILK